MRTRHGYREGGETNRKKKHISSGDECETWGTHPSSFALIFECFLGVLRGRLHVVHGVLHVVLYAVDHLSLRAVHWPLLQVP